MDKGVEGDLKSEGSPKQIPGTDEQKADKRLLREGNRALDWESPKVIRNPGSKSAGTGIMNKTLPREISPTVAKWQLSDQRWNEKGSEKSAEGIVGKDTSQHGELEDSRNAEGLNLLV